MIDQLKLTLRKKIMQWKVQKESWWISKKSRDLLWLERIIVIKKIADAIQYIHAKGIVHRVIDAKNIGFCTKKNVKLFDFSFAKSVGRVGTNNNRYMTTNGGLFGDDKDVFALTIKTGRLRYRCACSCNKIVYAF